MKITSGKMDRALAARWRRWAGHMMRWGGGLMAVGSLLPWAWVPLPGLRLPLPGLVGWGAVTLLLGVWLFRRAPWPATGAAALASLFIAATARKTLPAAIVGLFLGLETRLQPMNDLLARFGISPLRFFEFGASWEQLRVPGIPVVMLGAAVALAGSALAATTARRAHAMGRCSACSHRDRTGRTLAFCVRCGAPMPAERACPACHTLAEPGDLCCGVCGAGLPECGW